MRKSALTLCVLMVFGCEPADDHGHDDEPHGHEHPGDEQSNSTRVLTFTDALELFAEHPAAIAGEAWTLTAHLTRLEDFSPVHGGEVRLTLRGTEPVELSERAQSPGIYRFEITAPGSGVYEAELTLDTDETIRFPLIVFASASGATLLAQETDDEGTVPFLKEQQWRVPFGTAFATEGEIIPSLEVSGEITTPPSGRADIGATITGRVVAPAAGLARPGDVVAAGQLLATIAPAPAAPEAAARADLAVIEADARQEAARAALARAERLLVDRAISERAVNDARRELTVASEAIHTARRARQIFAGAASGRGRGAYRITAPIAGVMVDVPVSEGQSVNGGELLFRVVNMDELWVEAHVPEQDAHRLRADQGASFRFAGVDTQPWMPLRVEDANSGATVVHAGQVVDPQSRTVHLIYALRPPFPQMRVGGLVQVAVPVGTPWTGVVVPRDAVLSDGGRSVIYVQLQGETFERREVRLGPTSGALVGITRGIESQERVVTRGANILRLSALTPAAPAHGHVH